MSAKSDAYSKNLGSMQFRQNYDQIAWNSRIPVITEAQNMPKKSVSEVPSIKPCIDFVLQSDMSGQGC